MKVLYMLAFLVSILFLAPLAIIYAVRDLCIRIGNDKIAVKSLFFTSLFILAFSFGLSEICRFDQQDIKTKRAQEEKFLHQFYVHIRTIREAQKAEIKSIKNIKKIKSVTHK